MVEMNSLESNLPPEKKTDAWTWKTSWCLMFYFLEELHLVVNLWQTLIRCLVYTYQSLSLNIGYWQDSEKNISSTSPRHVCFLLGGQNPAPVDTVNIPLFTRFYTSKVVQDFFQQQYVHRKPCNPAGVCLIRPGRGPAVESPKFGAVPSVRKKKTSRRGKVAPKRGPDISWMSCLEEDPFLKPIPSMYGYLPTFTIKNQPNIG